MNESHQQKVIIAGAGIAGLTLALALRQAAGAALEIVICDPKLHGRRKSGRATAIAAGPRRMLEALGVWQKVAAKAQPIATMIITDSRLQDAVRPTYLQFGGEAAPKDAFAHMLEDDELLEVLVEAVTAQGATIVEEALADATFNGSSVTATTSSGALVQAALLVAVDGAKSRLRSRAGLAVVGWHYRQSGVVATLAHEIPHEGQAEEHFLPAGPFAVLPLVDNRISIVWTLGKAEAQEAVHLPADEFVERVQVHMGRHLGHMRLLGRPSSFPLALQLPRSLVAPRFALAGDAAHVIHPIAGQGLNLGFRDVAVLAELICDQARLGLDVGTPDLLQTYQRLRRFDNLTMAFATDGLNRLFANDIAPLRLARDFGIGLVNRMPQLKRLFIGEAAGLAAEGPRLMRGVWP